MAEQRAGDAPALPASVLPIRVAPGQTLSPEDYHYMVNVRYPVLERALPPERVAGLLAKVRDALPRMTFLWVRLSQPQPGECFMVVRPETPGARVPSDGYAGWHASAGDAARVSLSGVTLDVVRHVCPASGVARTEYRLVSDAPAGGCLVFVHYLACADAPRASDVPAPRGPGRPVVRTSIPAVSRAVPAVSAVPSAPAPASSASAPAAASAEDAAPDLLAAPDPLLEGDRSAVSEHAALRMAGRSAIFARLFSADAVRADASGAGEEALRAALRDAAADAQREAAEISSALGAQAAASRRSSALAADVRAALSAGGPDAGAAVLVSYAVDALGDASLVFALPGVLQ